MKQTLIYSLVLLSAVVVPANAEEKKSRFSLFRRDAAEQPKVEPVSNGMTKSEREETHVTRRPDLVYVVKPSDRQVRKRSLTKLAAGTLVKLVRMGSDYSEVKLQNGDRGWIATPSLRIAQEEDYPIIATAEVIEEKRVAKSGTAAAYVPPASFIEPDLPDEASSPMSFELLAPQASVEQ